MDESWAEEEEKGKAKWVEIIKDPWTGEGVPLKVLREVAERQLRGRQVCKPPFWKWMAEREAQKGERFPREANNREARRSLNSPGSSCGRTQSPPKAQRDTRQKV